MAKKQDKKKIPMKNNDLLLDILVQSHQQSAAKVKQSSVDDLVSENLEIVDDKTTKKKKSTIEWKDIKKSHGFQSKPVEVWSNAVLFRYFKSLCVQKNIVYKEIIDTEIGCARIGAFIQEVKNNYKSIAGKQPENCEIKSYLEYFVSFEIDKYVAKHATFTIYALRNQRPIKNYLSFVNKNNSNCVTEDIGNTVKTNILEQEITDQKCAHKNIIDADIEAAYAAGGFQMLSEFGLVHSIDFLCRCKNLGLDNSIKVVNRFFVDAQKEGITISKSILQITEKNSPYRADLNTSQIVNYLQSVHCGRIVFLTQ